MAITRTWIGGGNNNVASPSHWSPTGVPQPGDTLLMRSGTANMIDGTLAGDTLILADQPYSSATQTLNMFWNARIEKLEVGFNNATVNVYGHDTINHLQTNLGYGNYVTINIEPFSSLRMQVSDPPTPEGVHVIGITRASLLINDGPSFVQSGLIDVDVAGHGSWTPAGFYPGITFDRAVGGGQTVHMNNSVAGLLINDPADFRGIVDLVQPFWGSASLHGVHGDSFSYDHGVLKITSSGNVVDTLRVQESAGAAFTLTNSTDGLNIRQSFAPQQHSGLIV